MRALSTFNPHFSKGGQGGFVAVMIIIGLL